MKKQFALGIITISLLGACNDSDTTHSTSDTTTMLSTDLHTNKNAADTGVLKEVPVDPATNDFVAKAAAGGMMEIELAKVAKNKARSQRVKDYAAMLLRDHTAAAHELKSTAAGNNIPVPESMGAEHQQQIELMSKKSGTEFDKAYMTMMVIDHKKELDAYKKASIDLQHDAIKSLATRTVPILQKHLDSALAITKKM